MDTARQVIGSGVDLSSVRLNPEIRYLRVTVSGRAALMALGYTENHPLGPIEVWYSAEREVLRFQNGRLVGAVGLTTEWREATLPAFPPWSALATATSPFRWTRVRDLMPGYRYGIKDMLSLRVISDPARGELRGLDPDSLTWFEERAELEPLARVSAFFDNSIAGDLALPAARYAVDLRLGQGTVVYGEQCLSRTLCLTWQRWPAANTTDGK